MKILMIDNYDSFTYNLVHLLRSFAGIEVAVRRNDEVSLDEIAAYDRIVLSPGPGIPSEAGLMPRIVEQYAPSKKILGVCLGHQCIGEAFGGKLLNLGAPIHGKATPATVTDPSELLFKGLGPKLSVGRYHSWVVESDTLPKVLHVTAVDDAGQIMAFRHETYDVRGVQFHPESILTPDGPIILKNWIEDEAGA